MSAVESCDNCGICCMHMATPPFVGALDPRWRRLTPQMQQAINAWVFSPRRAKMGDEGPCCWFDLLGGHCRYHELRPDICRDFKRGGKDCLRMRREAGIP